jgi:hypothetical protein
MVRFSCQTSDLSIPKAWVMSHGGEGLLKYLEARFVTRFQTCPRAHFYLQFCCEGCWLAVIELHYARYVAPSKCQDLWLSVLSAELIVQNLHAQVLHVHKPESWPACWVVARVKYSTAFNGGKPLKNLAATYFNNGSLLHESKWCRK